MYLFKKQQHCQTADSKSKIQLCFLNIWKRTGVGEEFADNCRASTDLGHRIAKCKSPSGMSEGSSAGYVPQDAKDVSLSN